MAAPGSSGGPLGEDERAELARLREEAQTWSRHRHPGRWFGAVALLLLGAVLAIASISAVFLRQEVLDTQAYVATVAPLAREPAIQAEVAELLAEEIVTRLDLSDRLQQLADEIEELGAPDLIDALVTPAADGIQSFLRSQLQAIMETDEFAQAWEAANRVAHDELAALLTTGRGELLEAEGDEIYLDLGAVVALVREQLVEVGFPLAEEIPDDLSITYPIFEADRLPQLQTATYLLDQAAWVLPLLTLLLLGAGVLIAPGRRRALLIAAVAIGVLILLTLTGLALARTYYLDRLPADVSSPAAATALVDTVLRFYLDSLRTLLVLAVIVAVAAWLAGPSRPAAAVRRVAGQGLDLAARGLRRAGLRGPVPRFGAAHRRVIEVAIVIIAIAVLVIWRQPGVSGTLWLTAATLAALGLVELLARVELVATDPGRRSPGQLSPGRLRPAG